MVLYKRKQVSFLSSPQIPDDTTIQVYYIPQTKEWFLNYEDYLNRMDYFKRKKFVCEITGNSCLTFFEALQSEAKEIEGVERNFPEALREHILRFLQFNRITRLDQLVDKVYSVFKNDFFPGETIFIKGTLTDYNSLKKTINHSSSCPTDDMDHDDENQPLIKQRGIIREKVQQRQGDSITTKYLVVRLNDMQQSIVTPDKIARDRNHFTKWLIKTFIKLTMARSHKVNAPWVVKDKFAKKYRIPQVYPDDLIQFADSTPTGEHIIKDHPNNQRLNQGRSKSQTKSGQNYVFQQETGDEEKKIRKKPGPKAGSKRKVNTAAMAAKQASLAEKAAALELKEKQKKELLLIQQQEQQKLQQQQILLKKKFPAHYLPENLELDDDLFISERSTPTVNGGTTTTQQQLNVINSSSLQPTKKHITNDLEIKFDIQNPKPAPQPLLLPENAKSWNKHLISELSSQKDVKMKDDDSNEDEEEEEDVKPNRKFTVKSNDEEFEVSNFTPEALSDLKSLSSHKIKAVQDALQSWIFMNVYHSPLNLDTFTFDDFIYAMGWNSDQYNELGRCELLDEIWCSILSAFISNQIPTNKELTAAKEKDAIFGLQIQFPSKDSFISPTGVKKELDGNVEDDDERGSDSEHEEKTLKSEDDEEDEDEEDEDTIKKPLKSKSKSSSNGTRKGEAGAVEVEDADAEDEDEDEDEHNDNEEDDDDDEDDEDNDHIKQSDDVDHNAYVVMNHRNSSWDDRLRKRNFKDGNWQCILLGLLSQVEYVPAYKPLIDKLYHILAPKHLPATPSTVLNQFYEKLDINLKFQILKILVDLLISGTKVRSYIDECLDASTNLRRNRLDNIRDYKISLENAQRVNAIMVEMLHEHNKSTSDSKEEAVATPTPAPAASASENGSTTTTTTTVIRRPRLNYQAFEMTEIEKTFSEQNSTFKDLWHERKDSLLKLKQLKLDKREIEIRLTELDCQRVKLLGKDRLFNRYWWFENNGLPTLHGGTNDEDDNDDETKDKDADDNGNDEVDGKDEVLEETYLMGKLWVQGPSDDDLRIYFKTNFDNSNQFNEEYSKFEFEEFINRLNKQATNDNVDSDEEGDEKVTVKEENTEIKEEDDESSTSPNKEKRTQIKQMDFTKLPVPFTKTVSKLYDLNFTSNEIRKGDEGDLIIDHEGALVSYEKLQTLSPFQRKSIEEYADPLINGSNWRFYDKPDQIVKLISWLNPWGKRESQLKKELTLVKDAIMSSIEARRKAIWLDKTPEEEVLIQSNIDIIVKRIKDIKNGEEDGEGDEEEDDESVGPKRNLRRKFTPRKKQKIHTVSDVVEFGDISQLQEFESKLKQKLKEKREERDLSRVLEWVNSKALELFDKSLYDGGDKWKSKHSKRTKR